LLALHAIGMFRQVGDRGEIESGDDALAHAVLKLRRAQALRDQRRGGAEFVQHIERWRMKCRGARFLGQRRSDLEHRHRQAVAHEVGRRRQAHRPGAGDEDAFLDRHSFSPLIRASALGLS